MQTNQPILSICLPTNGVVQWVIPTLHSVYNQGVDLSLFEVVITDNGENSPLADAIKAFDYPNLRYIPTKDKGFLNLVTCLQKGNGLFNKMLNHRMALKPGMLQKMIDVVNRYKETKPVLYFLNGQQRSLALFTACDNLDHFVYDMNYWVSWSAGIGFWDVDKSKLSEIMPNEMFPNASLLFEHRQNTNYVIWNEEYGEMQDDSGKGGYDLFHTFGVVLNDLFTDLNNRGRISDKTYKHVQNRLYLFLCSLYYNEVIRVKDSKHSFIVKDIKASIKTYYGLTGYYWMIVREHLVLLKAIVLRRG